MTHTTTEMQRRLIALKYLAPLDENGRPNDDGTFGSRSLDAYNHYRAAKGFGPVNGASMAQLDQDLFPEDYSTPKGLNIVQASFLDYVFNLLQSKIGWAAAAMIGLVVAWINTRFGITVPADMQNLITGLLVSGFGALIMLLRGWFNAPKVATKQPEIVVTK